MNIMIAGGLGFIGFHLGVHLSRFNHSVIAVDPKPMESSQKTQCIHSDIFTIKKRIESVVDSPIINDRIDLIINCASPVGILGILHHKGRIVEQMVSATSACVQLAKRHHARLIHISSSEVYGKSGFLTEEEPLCVNLSKTPRSEYQIGKIACESIVCSQIQDAVIVRAFNIVGPMQDGEKGFVIPRFVEAAIQRKPLPIFYDGLQKRSFCDITDFASAIRLIVDLPSALGDLGVLNVGNPQNVTPIKTLAKKIANACNWNEPEFIHIRPEKDFNGFQEGKEKLPNIDKIQSLLNWNPKKNIDEIIHNYVQWADENNLALNT